MLRYFGRFSLQDQKSGFALPRIQTLPQSFEVLIAADGSTSKRPLHRTAKFVEHNLGAPLVARRQKSPGSHY